MGSHAAVLALVLAYIMPSFGVLKRMANNRDEVNTPGFKAEGVAQIAPVLAKDVASLLGTTWNSGELTLNVSLAVRFPGRCRIELTSPETTKSIVVTWTNGKRRTEGGELPALGAGLEQACALLSAKSSEEGATREGFLRHLQSLKVETKNISLARWYGTVSYLIGTRAEGQSQLWVYKDTFLPSRLKYSDEAGAWDVRFSDYNSQATGAIWPRVLEVEKGAEPQLRVMILHADLKADVTNVKF
jgi:hypothetical protein